MPSGAPNAGPTRGLSQMRLRSFCPGYVALSRGTAVRDHAVLRDRCPGYSLIPAGLGPTARTSIRGCPATRVNANDGRGLGGRKTNSRWHLDASRSRRSTEWQKSDRFWLRTLLASPIHFEGVRSTRAEANINESE